MVTDITLGAGASTDPLPVVKFLRKQGVKILVDSAYRQLTMLSGVLSSLVPSQV
jgi:hypothetical protein